MPWALLRRGLATGAIAGLLAAAFSFVVGEPRVERAIAVEHRLEASEDAHTGASATASSHAHGGAEAETAVDSRSVQQAGLVLALLLYGALIGGLFALAFALVRGRVGAEGDWALSTRLAGALFAAVVLLPFLKYPANPPAVGSPETVGERTALYLTMVALSLAALVAAVRAARAVRAGAPPWARPLAAVLTFAGTGLIAMVLLPAGTAAPPTFPADLLWEFRLSSLGTQLVLWSALGVGFGIASHRAAAASPSAR